MRPNWKEPCIGLSDIIGYGDYYDRPLYNPHPYSKIIKELFYNNKGEENMTMERMDRTLASRGFKVTREYDSYSKKYKFEIEKDGFAVTDVFVYPGSCDNAGRDYMQREFINQIINKWETEYQKDRIRRSYCKQDIESTKRIRENYRFAIKKVIFNEPATIVLWADGTKTVVKCQEDDIFDPEVGLAMAISKRALGDKGSYCNVFKKWCEPYHQKQEEVEAVYPKATISEVAAAYGRLEEEITKVKSDFLKFIENRIAEKKNKENAGES